MPSILTIPLNADNPWPPDFSDQRAMHAIALAAWNRMDPDLAVRLHEAQSKPFTQGLLAGPSGVQWRLTLLDDALYEPLWAGLSQRPEVSIQDRPAALDPAAAVTQRTSYAELAAAPPRERYSFRFATPTSFRQRTHHLPLPDPYLCFQSWWTRWNDFAPAELGINIAVLDVARAHLVITRFRLESQLVADGPRRVVGSVGRMTFLPVRREQLDPQWWQHVATLAAFAPYCGTGHKIAQGMGMTLLRPALRDVVN
jgi:CRISPR-associated endoribonuclease Cas6